MNSALMSSSYLMSVTLNTEWLAWTVETPQKSTFMIKEWQMKMLAGQVSPKF